MWSVIKGWLDPVTVEKIKILGSGYEKELVQQVSRHALLSSLWVCLLLILSSRLQIPAENLPESLGGTCNCEGGCSLSDAGPWNTDAGRKIVEQVKDEKHARIASENADAAK